MYRLPSKAEKSFFRIYWILGFILFVSDSGGHYTDSAHSFIFSFKNKDGLEPFTLLVKKTDDAMYGNNGYGPTFGGGHDIHISDGAGHNTNSYTNLGHSYVQLAGYKYGASDAQSLLAGSYNFQPHEVEVFYQTYKNWKFGFINRGKLATAKKFNSWFFELALYLHYCEGGGLVLVKYSYRLILKEKMLSRFTTPRTQHDSFSKNVPFWTYKEGRGENATPPPPLPP